MIAANGSVPTIALASGRTDGSDVFVTSSGGGGITWGQPHCRGSTDATSRFIHGVGGGIAVGWLEQDRAQRKHALRVARTLRSLPV